MRNVVQENARSIQTLQASPSEHLRRIGNLLYYQNFSSPEEAVEKMLAELVDYNQDLVGDDPPAPAPGQLVLDV